MRLPVMPPIRPMLSRSVPQVPEGMHYEPKWDGFRAIVFRDADEVELGSRNERPLTRYFPEVLAAVRSNLPERCVVDGEIVIVSGDRLDFDALLNRIHPADIRVLLVPQEELRKGVPVDVVDDLPGVAMGLQPAGRSPTGTA